jgi:hypothetical protein
MDTIPILFSATASIDNGARGSYKGSIARYEQSNNDDTLYIHWRR